MSSSTGSATSTTDSVSTSLGLRVAPTTDVPVRQPRWLLVAAGFRDAQMEAGSGPGFTWPARNPPVLRLDWILSRGLVASEARVGSARASDHRPVITELAWPQ